MTMLRQVDVQVLAENVCHLPKMPIEHVKADIAKGRSMIGGEHFVAVGCEIGPRDGYAKAWVEGMVGMRTYGADVECPVSISKGMQFIAWHKKRLTRGIKALSPDRWRVEVQVNIDGLAVAVIGSHNVSQSKNPHASRLSVRKQLFSVWRFKMRRRIKRLHALGYTVIAAGDFNAPNPVNLHPDQQVIVCRDLMQIIAIPAEDVTATRHGEVRYGHGHTDHVIPAATVRLSKAVA